MRFENTEIPGCFIIHPDPIADERGWFTRVFCEEEFLPHSGAINFSQINHSFNKAKGTFRGMHFQNPPYGEEKLIRCISGKVMDFILDLRKDSPSFLKYIFVELSSQNKQMIFLPKGVAHGFQTLEDNSELIYHHTEKFNKDADRGLRFDDPLINIELPLSISVISEKDKKYSFLEKDFKGI